MGKILIEETYVKLEMFTWMLEIANFYTVLNLSIMQRGNRMVPKVRYMKFYPFSFKKTIILIIVLILTHLY